MKKQLTLIAIAALATSAAFAQATDTLAKIKERGAVNLGVRDSSGLAFTLGGGKYVGFHTEMAENIIKDIGKEMGKPLTINYQVITSQNRVPLVQNGTIDFECGSTTNNT
ncbi:transporter substrate-binding domain-containing protein, partial [Pseudacidovorax intermedius]|uniref:transporter substrate-binding domain-containing protein n=2 Tax=Pseudacidovorax TaxID=433923 RepID=UPI0026EA50B1